MEASQRSEDIPRKKVEVSVDCATEDMQEPVTLTTQDIGAGGLFIQTDYPLDIGTRFGCRFDLGAGDPILAECEVAWVRTGEEGDPQPTGMGVRFVALEAEDLERLRGWVTGEEIAVDDGETPRVTFRIEGLGQTVPGEFRALSDDGMSAVAELPFLKVGSAVQVSVDEPGDGPRAGRIAWLVVEDPEESDAEAPRIRLGIHFDETAEAALTEQGPIVAEEPVPLTVRKKSPVMADTPLVDDTPVDDPSLAPEAMAPWDLGTGNATTAAAPASPGRRRRVRGRQKKSALNVSHLWSTVRDQASRHPRIAMGVGAGSGVLLVALMASLAFGGSGKAPAKKKAKPKVAAAQPPANVQPPAADPGAVAPPNAQPLPPTGPSAAPPLPGAAKGGPAVLRSGEGANADPGKVLDDPKAKGGNKLLAEPKVAVKKRIHTYSLGGKLVVKLPLQQKPKRVKHYLLANPDGAVVDAAGAAPLIKPGRYKVKDRRIKLVKVLNRGKAARFIVYYGKGVKAPKLRLMPTDDGVNFVITAKRPRPRVAKRGMSAKRRGAVARKRGAKLKARKRRTATKRRAKPRKRRPAPIADASDD